MKQLEIQILCLRVEGSLIPAPRVLSMRDASVAAAMRPLVKPV